MADDAPGPDRLQQLRRIIRHDLRNPLAIIIGRCELLEAEVLGPLEDRQRESVTAISRHAERLAEELDGLAALLDEAMPGEGNAPRRG